MMNPSIQIGSVREMRRIVHYAPRSPVAIFCAPRLTELPHNWYTTALHISASSECRAIVT